MVADYSSGEQEINAETGTRQRLMSAAREEFARYGVSGARVDRIARNASVNKAMLYYHFHSKELLYEAVVKEFFSAAATHIREHVVTFESLEQALTGVAETHALLMTRFPDIVPIILRELADRNSSFIDWIANTIGGTGITAAAQSRLEESFRSGEHRRLDVRQVMTSFVAMSLGYYLLAPLLDRIWNIHDKDAFIEERKKIIVDLIMNGIRMKSI